MNRFCFAIALLMVLGGKSFSQDNIILNSADFKHYVDKFNENDKELYKQYIPNDSAWQFLKSTIPFFECPDKNIEITYYFRWWTYRKHIRKIPSGFVITEFLPNVNWSGKYNTISCAAGHHFYEGRWLKTDKILNDYARFWFTEGEPRRYSFWPANSLLEYYKVTQDSIVFELLPELIDNYKAWGKGWEYKGYPIGRKADGLYSTLADRDGMEEQISGDGKRPTINSYMYGEAIAISKIAEMIGNKDIEKEYLQIADTLKALVLNKLWDNTVDFFKTRSEIDDQLADVRELQGYTPWYFNLPPQNEKYHVAWELIKKSDGFDSPYGLTTAEQSHPKYEIAYSGHQCLWNGPVWPYSTSITLTALANELNNYQQEVVDKRDFYRHFVKYSLSHRFVDDHGNVLPWIDENMNPYTGDWISRTRLKVWEDGTWSDKKGGVERGKDYNHSTYCDILISGLIGVRPQEDNSIVINPLIPDNIWDWFCLDGLEYKGKFITILYDKYGTKYSQGTGFLIFSNGKLIAHRDKIEKIRIALESN